MWNYSNSLLHSLLRTHVYINSRFCKSTRTPRHVAGDWPEPSARTLRAMGIPGAGQVQLSTPPIYAPRLKRAPHAGDMRSAALATGRRGVRFLRLVAKLKAGSKVVVDGERGQCTQYHGATGEWSVVLERGVTVRVAQKTVKPEGELPSDFPKLLRRAAWETHKRDARRMTEADLTGAMGADGTKVPLHRVRVVQDLLRGFPNSAWSSPLRQVGCWRHSLKGGVAARPRPCALRAHRGDCRAGRAAVPPVLSDPPGR